MDLQNKQILSLLLLVLFIVSCKNREEASSVVDFPYDLLREGDIVFRRGTGIVSRVVIAADKQGHYSHIGIVVKDNNAWKVAHAVPGEPDFNGDPDRIKLDNVSLFFCTKRAKSGALMRVSADSALCNNAARHAFRLYQTHILFDHDYNLNDSSQMYCTEFVDYVYKHQGIDLTEERISRVNVPGLSGEYLLPSDIQQSRLLNVIYHF